MWAPVKTVTDVVKFLMDMLSNPSSDGPQEIDAAKQMKENITEFEKKASNSCSSLRK